MGMFDDIPLEGATQGSGMFGDVPMEQPKPVRFMEPPTATENLLAGINLPDWMNNLRGTAPYRVMQGMADPAVGAVQFAANILPNATGIPQAVNQRVAQENQQYEQARAAQDSTGFDPARLAGNILSPVNLAVASKVPAAATTGMRILQGAAVGGGTSAMQPITNTESGFWNQKVPQVATGALVGAVLTPVLGAIGDRVVRKLAPSTGAVSPQQIDQTINDSLKEMGQTIDDVPPAQLQALRAQVNGALQQGQEVSPAAVMRKADFEALGIKPTLGQITRDPMQFAKEQNLRGLQGIGQPLSDRLQQQGYQLQDRLSVPAAGAQDAYTAGTQISGSLKSADDLMRQQVTSLYDQARASTGKDLTVPLTGLAQKYGGILDNYGDNVPGAIQQKFAALGLDPANPSNQKALFTFKDANDLLQAINKNDPGFANRPVSSALGEIRSALKDAITAADPKGGPFGPAVSAAREHFQLLDAVPALKAAADGTVAPDNFVNRFIINGKTNEVKGLSQVLQQADPASYQEARAQIADSLKRAAFGENATGDAPFAPTRYMAKIRSLGVDKIGAFFSPAEVQDIVRVGRVGSLIKQAPNASAVNTSNTASSLVNLLPHVPFVGKYAGAALNIGKNIATTVNNPAAVNAALAANVPFTPAPLSLAQKNYLAYLLAGGAAAGGTATGAIGQ